MLCPSKTNSSSHQRQIANQRQIALPQVPLHNLSQSKISVEKLMNQAALNLNDD